jgi:hypothetical protein
MNNTYPKEHRENLELRRKVLLRAKQEPEYRAKVKSLFHKDPLFAFNVFFWTYDPRKRPLHDMPFMTWDYEDDFILEVIASVKGGYDFLGEKSRDMGVSWCVLTAFLWLWLNPTGGTDFLLGSRVEDYVDKKGDMRALFPKIRYNLYKLPKWLRPKNFNLRQHDNHMKLINPETGATLTGESANPNYSTGGRYAAVFFDEFAKWEHDISAWTAAGDASPCRIAVSTAFGVSNQFYNLVTDSNIKRMTMHWSIHPEKSVGLNCIWPPPNEDDKLVAKENWKPREKLTSPWYEQEIHRRDSREVAQELDINYLGSGMPVFDGRAWEALQALHQLNMQPKAYFRPRLEERKLEQFAGEPLDLQGYLKVYEFPEKFKTYSMGVDVVEGRADGDFSVITVLCRETKDVVASYYSRLDENLLALVVLAVSNFYTKPKDSYWAPWVGIETPGPGLATFDECERLGVNNLFVSATLDSTRASVAYKKGWRNTTISRPELLAGLKKWLAYRMGVAHPRAIGEMMTLEYGKTGKPQAKGRHHDDEVFALGIALQVDEQAPYERVKGDPVPLRSDGLPEDLFVFKDAPPEPTYAERCMEQALAKRSVAIQEAMFYEEIP